jgi:RND family efflux transporter MFP subunit
MNDPGSSRPTRPSGVAPGQRVDARALLDSLHGLRLGPRSADFWSEFCASAAQLCRAASAIVVAHEDSGWRPLGGFQLLESGLEARWPSQLADLLERIGDKGFGISPAAFGSGAIGVAIRLRGESDSILLLEIAETERPRLNELILRAQLIADIPESATRVMPAASTGASVSGSGAVSPAPAGRLWQEQAGKTPDSAELLGWLELVVRVTRHRSFGPASLELVNAVAARLGWTQVFLGWRRGPYVRVRAISHLDRFERRAEHVRLIEAAMEETLDHDAPVQDPVDQADAQPIAHGRLRQGLGFAVVSSLPLRGEADEAQAVLLLASDEASPPPVPLEPLQLAAQLAMPWLADLEEQDRWFGERWSLRAVRATGRAVRIEHLGRKSLIVATAALLLYGLFGTWPHRIDATAELVTDSAQILNAPFDGYVDTVHVTAGDSVRQGGVLATLDRQELLLQESEIRAEIRRHTAEAEKARAAAQTADVQIALARRAQAQARLDRVSHQIEQSRVLAPFDGVVVEGERKELLGAAIRRGDKLFRVARVEGLYVTLFLPEAEMRFLAADARGEISLLSQPEVTHPIRIDAVIPVAQVKPQTGNLFAIRAELLEPPESWWRPGMTGLARIDVGEANILWLLTRRAVDAIRMKLWW